MRRRTNLMKFQYYIFNVVISIVIKHFYLSPSPLPSVHPAYSQGPSECEFRLYIEFTRITCNKSKYKETLCYFIFPSRGFNKQLDDKSALIKRISFYYCYYNFHLAWFLRHYDVFIFSTIQKQSQLRKIIINNMFCCLILLLLLW